MFLLEIIQCLICSKFFSELASPASASDSSTANVTIPKSGEQSIANIFHAPLANSSTCSTTVTEATEFFICEDIQP